MSAIDERWEKGIPHKPEAVEMLRQINKMDETLALDLRTGGDGDVGETLLYFLDELIDEGILSITIHAGPTT